MSIVEQNELISTLIEQVQSLTHEVRSFRNSIDQDTKYIKEFTETSDTDYAKEIRNLIKTMELWRHSTAKYHYSSLTSVGRRQCSD